MKNIIMYMSKTHSLRYMAAHDSSLIVTLAIVSLLNVLTGNR